MAYFLKRTHTKKGLYLQIYESYHDPARKETRHRSVKALGYERALKAQGIEDPVAHFQAKVKCMNAERKAKRDNDKERRISDKSPVRHMGHFPLKAIWRGLGVDRDLRYFQLILGCPKVDIASLLQDLVYSRCVKPCSKSKSYTDVIPLLAGRDTSPYSLDQLYDTVEFLGSEYQKVCEVFNAHVERIYGRRTDISYFDCTNFYFEIDKEDALRRKGPSKEHRTDSIVGLGLLLDSDRIPLDMTIYPGNQSEKPELTEAILQMKRRGTLKGRTVRVADKGLNCAANISDALLSGDGYIFSKSVKILPEKERIWAISNGDDWHDVTDGSGSLLYRAKSATGDFEYRVSGADGKSKKVKLSEKRVVSFNPKLQRKQLAEISREVEKANALRLSKAKRSEYGDSAKFVTFTAVGEGGEVTGNNIVVTLNHDAIKRAKAVAGYNMIVTSEVKMAETQIYETYHDLWRIEETFREMKFELNARPVYLRKPDSIKGHFLICYLSVLLERLLQFKVLANRYPTHQVLELVRGFDAVEFAEGRYVNVSKRSDILEELEHMSALPLSKYYLTKKDISEIMKITLPIP